MYAELVVRTKRNLPRDLGAIIRDQWGRGMGAAQVVPLTDLADWDHWLHLVRFAQVTSSTAYLVFTPDARTLRLHVESRSHKCGLRLLREIIDDETRRVRALLSRHDNDAEDIVVRLYAERTHLQTGRVPTRMERLAARLGGDLLSTLYVPVSAFLLSLVLDYQLAQALYNVAAALAALLAWAAATVVLGRPGYQYKEE